MDDTAKTPLLDLLRSVPSDARAIYEHHAFASSSFPYGRLCAEAAERIAELEREVNEQARLLGISGSTEARLLARVAELERALDVATFHRDAYTAELARCREENAAMRKEGGE